MIISSRNVRKGASCSMMLSTIPQISIEQQQSEQQVTDLEMCQKYKAENIFCYHKQHSQQQQNCDAVECAHSSSAATSLDAPRGFLPRVAVRTMVNCIKLQDQIESVKNTRIGSSAIFFSLNESKNSMMSAAVPGRFNEEEER